MINVLNDLTKSLDGDMRSAVWTRAHGLTRGVRYEVEKKTANSINAMSAGWTPQQIEIICHLNAFYQIVLGPLASVARENLQLGLVKDTCIAYGEKTRVNGVDADILRECHNHFQAVIQQLGIDFWCIQAASANDLLFRLANPKSTS